MKRPILNRINMFLLGVIAGCIGCALIINNSLIEYQQKIIGNLSNQEMDTAK